MSETSEKLDHTLRAYGRLERKHGERGRELTAVKAERDAYKAALEEIAGQRGAKPASQIRDWCAERARSVLAGVVSTREKDERTDTANLVESIHDALVEWGGIKREAIEVGIRRAESAENPDGG